MGRVHYSDLKTWTSSLKLKARRGILGISTLFFASSLALSPMATAALPLSSKATTPPGFNVVGADPKSQDVTGILAVVNDLLDASNHHSLDGVLKHYSPRFVSGDNLALDQVQHLIEDTWKLYPDIKYSSKLLEIRVNGDWATVESMDSTHATAQGDALMSGGVPGKSTSGALDSRSRGLLFLHRAGKIWEVISDTTLYETATILFGDALKLHLGLSSPDQVFAGEPYTAKVDAAMPGGSFAIASITREPLVFPQRSPEEKFRTLSEDQNTLERVFQANQANRNEMVTATIGLTQVGQDDQEHPIVKLSGIATIVKRVNVLPKSKSDDLNNPVDSIIKRSASGLIDTSKQTEAAAAPGIPGLSTKLPVLPANGELLKNVRPAKNSAEPKVTPDKPGNDKAPVETR